MKLQDASKKELRRISVGTLLLSAVLVVVLWVLSLVGVGIFGLWDFLSVAAGALIAIGNFYILCLTIQKAVEIQDQKQMKMKFQVSYNARMLLQGIWVVVALLVPKFDVVAGAVPLLFPHLIIMTMGRKGMIPPAAKTEKTEEAPETSQQAPEDQA